MIQRPKIEGNWLYRDSGNDRYFTTIVALGVDDAEWPECTNEEKEQWEREHKPEEPEDVEPIEE